MPNINADRRSEEALQRLADFEAAGGKVVFTGAGSRTPEFWSVNAADPMVIRIVALEDRLAALESAFAKMALTLRNQEGD